MDSRVRGNDTESQARFELKLGTTYVASGTEKSWPSHAFRSVK
jgi:hypothetical protein